MMIETESAGHEALRRRGVLIVEQGGRGGVADYTGLLAAALSARGVPVTIATAGDHLYPPTPGVTVKPVFAYVRGHSAPARLVRRAGLGRLLNGLRFLVSLPALVGLARRHAITHVQGWEARPLGLIAMPLLRLSGATLVYTAHNTFERAPGLLDSAVIMPALARQTIVHTEADRHRVSRIPTVIAHGHYGSLADRTATVDPVRARDELGLPAEAPVVLLFGVLRPDKGLADVLDAAAQAPAWRVVIAGEDHEGLAGVADRLAVPALAERVTVLEGFHPMERVAELFAAADVVALPYRQASQSGVLHLAYGFARPVAAYPVGGLTEAVIPGVTGWICAEASPGALAEVLREAGEDGRAELRRRGQEGRRWAQRTFSWDRIAQETERVYLRALLAGGVQEATLSGLDATTGAGGDPSPPAQAPPPRR
jgi:glycosyltransferase involved in cell wall biosynthesis